MSVITFANTKGGAGKTTAVLILACELQRMGYSVAVFDADPQRWISKWFEQLGDKRPKGLSVVSYITASNLDLNIRELKNSVDFLLIDLPGARSPLLAQALGYSDYVLIPVQGSAMDAQGAANVIELLQYLDIKAGLHIPHSVLLTRINPMVTTRALQAVKEMLETKRVHLLETPIIERAAFRDVFGVGETLYTMDPQRVSNLEKAQHNAHMLGMEVFRRILPYVTARAQRSESKPLLNVA
ncbi:ParA family protein [Rhizobium sp. L1K21]|uniref:ParA family protein n=1 Tax=Rhizobium sp. L1K21 TaxID=2954933 RepID=UPI0020924B7A|nr:ParA family protein [Rhizobium sp. L1K21]MCO6188601.1 ParA family protein [Rhizobium sp. L1K21]